MQYANESITWFILAGRKTGNTPPIDWVERTRQALVIDLLEKLRNISIIDQIVVSSNDADFLHQVTNYDSRIIADELTVGERFHFGEWLRQRIKKYKPENLFYWGGGASPLITPELLETFCVSVVSGENILYTNNFFSADWVAFTPASAALDIEPPLMDNNLAYALWKERGIRSIYIEPSIEIIGDVDTPADLLILREDPRTGRETKKLLQELPLDTTRVKRFIEVLQDKNRVFLAGRVGSSLFKYLDNRCRCSFRILSEERGMRSSGRIGRREVKSLLAMMFHEPGLDKTFSFIESMADGIMIDSRVPFAHICGAVSTADRFYSDLGLYDEIRDPWVRDFTRRVMESPIPVLTGGHSLILGGLWALVSAHAEMPGFY